MKMLLQTFFALLGFFLCTSAFAERDTITLNDNWLFSINKTKEPRWNYEPVKIILMIMLLWNPVSAALKQN